MGRGSRGLEGEHPGGRGGGDGTLCEITPRAIEREVDYGKLSPWRRESLEGLHQRLGRGELDGENPNPSHQDDKAGFGLRLAEFEARVEDNKRLARWTVENRRWPWRELSEDQKLDSLAFENSATESGQRVDALRNRRPRGRPDLRVPQWRRSHVQSHQQPEVVDASREASGFTESRIAEAQPRLPSPSDIAKDKQPYIADASRITDTAGTAENDSVATREAPVVGPGLSLLIPSWRFSIAKPPFR